jgi:DNA-binding YbaB/EbfC family protein
MFDMMKMMGKVKELQQKMKDAQNELAKIEVIGESGAGLVNAKVNGQKKVISIQIDDSLINSADKEIVQDLVVAAVNKALAEVEVLAKEHIQKSTEGVMPNIPGLDLSQMFNG